MTGYRHNTYHRFLKVQFAVPPKAALGKFYRSVDGGGREARVSRLQVDGLTTPGVVDDLNTQLHSLMAEGFFDEGYELFGYAVRKVASKCLGEVSRDPMPEWKKANADRLAELSIQKREAASKSPLGCQSKEYKRVCRDAKKEVRRILNTWWAAKAESIQQQVDAKDHNHQFAGYRELRRVLATNRRAPGKLRDAQGELIFTLSGRVSRWREYFDELLNVPAVVSQAQMDKVSELPRAVSLDQVPSFSETVAALGRLKTGRASGPDGIEAEILMALDPVNMRALHEFFARVWMEYEPMPQIWKDAYLVPLPKRGDLTFCKRWRGILLASIPGKVFARILNARLATYVEERKILPESLCGFRPGRGTMDMAFALKLAMEIADYKKHPFHVLFVDLVKAYDSVSRAGLWAVLRKKGVPPKMLRLIQMYYTGKSARVCVEGNLSDSFELSTGLGQGCYLALLLFNIFLSAVFEAWQEESGGGVEWLTRIDGALLHRDPHEKYTTWDELKLEELGYADDAALVASTLAHLRDKATNFQTHLCTWGLNLSVEKTKALSTEMGPHPAIEVTEFEGFSQIDFVDRFEYLGVIVQRTGSGDAAVRERLEKARKAFWSLNSSVWSLKQLSLSTKVRVYRACVLSVLLYGAEVWTHTYPVRKALERFHFICLRRLSGYGIRYQREHSLSNDALRAWLGVPTIAELVSQARLRWLGHVGRMPDHRIPKRVLFGMLLPEIGTQRRPGLQAGKRLRDAFARDLVAAGLERQGWLQLANSKDGDATWRLKVRRLAAWYPPRNVQPGTQPPVRDPTSVKLEGKTRKRISHQQRLDTAGKRIRDEFCQTCAFLRVEDREGGREAFGQKLTTAVQIALGQDDISDFEQLCDVASGDWVMDMDTEGDLALLRLCISTAVLSLQAQAQGEGGPTHTGLTPRRVSRKRKPPAWYVFKQEEAKAELDANAPRRVRTKYRNLRNVDRSRTNPEGQFVCDFPGCNKRYTTKGGTFSS